MQGSCAGAVEVRNTSMLHSPSPEKLWWIVFDPAVEIQNFFSLLLVEGSFAALKNFSEGGVGWGGGEFEGGRESLKRGEEQQQFSITF